MSAYTDFVKDFSSRSLDLLNTIEEDAEAIDLEVTLLISIATSSFVMTYERMKINNPSSNSQLFPRTKQTLVEELKTTIKDSCLFNDEWKYVEVQKIEGDLDSWLNKEDGKSISQKNTKKMIDIIRNALSHGSMWTTGEKIDMLFFVSRKYNKQPTGPFEVLYCSPKAFKHFIKSWVELLNKP